MRYLLLAIVLLIAGCQAGISDTERAWCNDHGNDVARYQSVVQGTPLSDGTLPDGTLVPDWNTACDKAFRSQ